jgi:hypothetical protein
VKAHLNRAAPAPAPAYAFEVGEHVFVDGRDGEFVVVEVDRNTQTLQLLLVRSVGRIENFPASSVRIVLPPKMESSHEKEAKIDGFSAPPAA